METYVVLAINRKRNANLYVHDFFHTNMIITVLVLSQILSNVDPFGQVVVHISPKDGDETMFHYDMS